MGVRIGDKHTDDYSLTVTDMSISEPEVQTYSLEIPGRNGLLDLTEINGAVRYKNRTVKLSCVHQEKRPYYWHTCYSELLKNYHGKRCNIIFDSEKDYYYSGRLCISSTKNSQIHSSYTIIADCDPYAYEVQDRGEPWIWDIFNFDTGVIYQDNYYKVEINGTKALTIQHNGQMPVTPTFELISGALNVIYNGITYNLTAGNNTINEITISSNCTLTLSGIGVLSIHYRGGKL